MKFILVKENSFFSGIGSTYSAKGKESKIPLLTKDILLAVKFSSRDDASSQAKRFKLDVVEI